MSIENYSVDQICEWVMSLGIDPNPFKENAVEGRDLIELDDIELREYLGLKPLQVKKIRKRVEELLDTVPQKSIFQKYQEEVKKTGPSGGYSNDSASSFGSGSGYDGRPARQGFNDSSSSYDRKPARQGFNDSSSSYEPRHPNKDVREGNYGTQFDPSRMKPCERGLAKGVYASSADQVVERDLEFEREMFQEPNTGINFSKFSSIPVEATGNNVPAAISSFNEPNFHPTLMENIIRAKYKSPTPVQSYGIPIVLAGRDLMACAQTGSGKTVSFLFPILHLLISRGKTGTDQAREDGFSGRCAFPEALIITPTRELSLQIFDECRRFAYLTIARPVVIYGGADARPQLSELSRGCHILIATPGRLCQMIERRNINISRVVFFVLDEADRMLDMGFEPQIRDVVENHGLPDKQSRQTLMFSATFPREIQKIAGEFLNDYIFLTVGRVGSTNQNITQKILYVEENDKHDELLRVLSEKKKGLVLIFVQTKAQADTLEVYLTRSNFHADSIHGDRSQYERETALNSFKTGEKPYLVATDVAQRGLDIPNVTLVINFDMPANIDDYVHRIGRTGRAGNYGEAISFFNDSDTSLATDLVHLLTEVGQEVPSWLEACAREYNPSMRSRYKTARDSRNSAPRSDNSQQRFSNSNNGHSADFGSSTTETW